MKTLALVVASGLAGALVVVACSDDSPGDADAAVCDCPAAEAPITPARLHRVEESGIAASNTTTTPTAQCPAGELLLSGSCYIDIDNTAREVSVTYAGAEPNMATQEARFWQCHFLNTSLTETATVRAQALCLRPAP